MGILNKQIGWSTESNLLWDVLKKIDRLKSVASSSLNNLIQLITNVQTSFETTIKVQSLGNISGATAVNLSSGNIVLATLTAPTSFSFTSLPAVGFETAFSLRLSGIFAITFPVGTIFPAGIPPTPTGALYEIQCSIDSNGNLIVYGVINDIKTP